jgi:hypothetical protein
MKNKVPFNGSDQLMRGFDYEARRHGFAGNHCQIVLELSEAISPETLQQRLTTLTRSFPILNARLRGMFRPYWKINARNPSAPSVRVHAESPNLRQQLFNEPLRARRGELARFDLIKRSDGKLDLIFTWTHLLMDATAAEYFLAVISDESLAIPTGTTQPPGAPAQWPERLELMKKSVAQLDKFCEQQPRALKTRHPDASRQLQYHVETFSAEETARIRAHSSRLCGILGDAQFHATVAALELHRLHQKLGCPTKSYIVPMPVGLRPKGRLEPFFSNQVDMLMLQFLPTQLEGMEPAIAALKAQAAQAVREGSLSYGRKLSELFSFLPLPIYMKVLKHGLKGEICSLFFGDTAAVNPRLERFLGANVERFTHIAAVTPSPGLGVIFYYFRSQLCMTIIHAQTVLAETEAADFAASLRQRLLNP